ncbi:MAG: hypothetical protein IKV16_05885 [Clostridia bacterium]|nr:hypothetical protein [Clostridia bacterium]
MKNFIKNIFSPKLYLQGIKRIRAIGIAAAICTIIPNALIPIMEAMRSPSYDYNYIGTAEVGYGVFAPYLVLLMIFAPIMVYLTFSYLNERKKADFFHSIPQKRACVYTSFTLAIASWMAVIIGVSVIVNSVLWSFVPYHTLPVALPFEAFIYCFAAALLVAAYMLVAMTLTGSVVSNLLVFALLIFLPRLLTLLFTSCLESCANVFVLSGSVWKYLSYEGFLPLGAFLQFVSGDDSYLDISILLYGLTVAILLIVAAGAIYKARRSEMAGQSTPNRKLQAVYRTAVALPFLFWIVSECVVYGFEGETFLLLFCAAVISYMIFELMMTKSLKSMFRSLILFWIPVVVAVGFFGAVKASEFAVESVQPEGEEIEYVTLYNRYGGGMYGEYDKIPYEVKLSSSGACDMISSILRDHIEYEYDYRDGLRYEETSYWEDRNTYINVKIKLENGITVTRGLRFADDELARLVRYAADESEEYRESLIWLPKSEKIYRINICGGSTVYDGHGSGGFFNGSKILEMFYNEYNSLSDKEKAEYRTVGSNASAVYANCYMDVYFYDDNGRYVRIRLYLSEKYIPETSRYVYEIHIEQIEQKQ